MIDGLHTNVSRNNYFDMRFSSPLFRRSASRQAVRFVRASLSSSCLLLRQRGGFALLPFALAATAEGHATVTCARIFSDHMVLQRDRIAPVWGDAAPAESIVVEFDGVRVRTVAGPDGHW